MLEGIIATPSVSSVHPDFDQGNRQVAEQVAGWLELLGFAVQVIPIPGAPDKANVVGTLGSGSGGLLLAGHTDTVPFDRERWTSDPFTLAERDGRLYGLGTSDMKSFIPIAIEAARAFKAGQFARPLTILGTADEESSMCGAAALTAGQLAHPAHAVIGEPTGMAPVHVHKGILMEAIRLTGSGGHSSDPAGGASALDAMQRVMGALMEWRTQLGTRHRDTRFAVPVPTLNLGHIHGGDNPNRICAACELHIDLRPLPGMGVDELRAELAQRVHSAIAGSGVGAEVFPLFAGTSAMETPEQAPIVQAAAELSGQTPRAVTFGTEGPYLTALGIDTVILGPGDIAQAHRPDEYLELSRIPPTVEILRTLVHRFCVGA